MRILIALCIMTALTTSPIWAQNTGIVNGTVSSRTLANNVEVLHPLKEARLSVHFVEPTSNNEQFPRFRAGPELTATTTDKNGRFTFLGLQPGLVYIEVEAPGYVPVGFPVCVEVDDSRTLPIQLWTSATIGLPYQMAQYKYNANLGYRPGEC